MSNESTDWMLISWVLEYFQFILVGEHAGLLNDDIIGITSLSGGG